MTRARGRQCFECERLTFRAPEGAPAGSAWCVMFERVEPWDSQACVIFHEARNLHERAQWAERKREREASKICE